MSDKIHVLIVEDTLIAQRVAEFQMVRQGCTVDIAADGAKALEKAGNTPYDLILMDIGLGQGPDGFEVTKQIKAECPLNATTPVFAVTAHGGSELQTKMEDCGMSGYYHKPLTPENAQEIINFLKKT
jgi:two-component system chemotaxis response regulator CheY